MVKVLFVCLGNICRSPMAEGLFQHLVHEAGLSDQITVDSAGTSGWHVGEMADARMRETSARRGITLTSRARQVHHSDFTVFDYIIPMDESNLEDLEELKARMEDTTAELIKMRDFDELAKGADVPDPYYGGHRGFEDVYEMLERSCGELLAYIREKHGL